NQWFCSVVFCCVLLSDEGQVEPTPLDESSLLSSPAEGSRAAASGGDDGSSSGSNVLAQQLTDQI
ncbi:hypothetical protein ILYODFUR_035156, partial [Ilyodon furcidens]